MVEFAFPAGDRQGKLVGDGEVELHHRVQREVRRGDDHALDGGGLSGDHLQMRLVDLGEGGLEQREVGLAEDGGELGDEPLRHLRPPGRRRERGGLEEFAVGEGGPLPIRGRLRRREGAVEGDAAALRGEQPVEAGLMPPAIGVGRPGGGALAERVVRPPPPVARPPERDRRRHRLFEALEVPHRLARPVEAAQGEIARQPFQRGMGGAGLGSMPRGDVVGDAPPSVLHQQPRQGQAPACPAIRLAESLRGAALPDGDLGGVKQVAALHQPDEEGVGHARILAVGGGRVGDGAAGDAVPQPPDAAGLAVDEREHVVDAVESAPENHVEALGVMGREISSVAGEECAPLRSGHLQRRPRLDGGAPRRFGVAGFGMRPRKREGAVAGLRGASLEEGENRRGVGLGEAGLALPAHQAQAGPVGMAAQEVDHFARLAESRAQPVPLYDRGGDRSVAFGESPGVAPAPAVHRVERARERARRDRGGGGQRRGLRGGREHQCQGDRVAHVVGLSGGCETASLCNPAIGVQRKGPGESCAPASGGGLPRHGFSGNARRAQSALHGSLSRRERDPARRSKEPGMIGARICRGNER